MAIKTFVGTKYSRFETYSTKKHDRHTLHHDKPPILKDNITGQHLTPYLSSTLGPFQSYLCTANDLIAITFFRKKESQLLLPTLDHSGPHRLIGHLRSQKLLQTVDNTPTAKRLLPRRIVIVEDIINHTRTLPPLLRVQHLVHQLPLVFPLVRKQKRADSIRPKSTNLYGRNYKRNHRSGTPSRQRR
ncbi:unnamed protein product [Brassica rapa subsp. trilocularis]